MSTDLPIVRELPAVPDMADAFLRMATMPRCAFFDSARRNAKLGRYSFLAADPFKYLERPADGSDSLQALRATLAPFVAKCRSDLPPFQGGAAGLFGYGLAQSLEAVPQPEFDEFQVPAMAIGLYDVVLAVDHVLDRAWIISQGFPEQQPRLRRQRAMRRLEQFAELLAHPPYEPRAPHDDEVPVNLRAPNRPIATFLGLASNFSRDEYLAAVARAIEYIRAGDIFQVNLAQRLIAPASGSPRALYLRLRERNPATFAGYYDLGRFQICSASPERFVQVREGEVETRPIKGTRGKTLQPEADLFAGDELQASEKDRAENVMIVDLVRNDLARVCLPESVRVTQLCQLEQYEFVQHLVSAVCGTLRPDLSAIDLLRAAFPGGSITGAPKIRAQQIITELERVARGAYCGSLGYLGFDGTLDTNLLIRTITVGGGWWQAPVGGGIVAQSVPEREYEETWHKAEGMLRALR